MIRKKIIITKNKYEIFFVCDFRGKRQVHFASAASRGLYYGPIDS